MMTSSLNRQTAIAVAVAVAIVVAVIALSIYMWDSVSGAEMGAAGWIAMLLGVLATLALGVGLMSLMFISARRGYDEHGDGR
jgi:hypothetical protein